MPEKAINSVRIGCRIVDPHEARTAAQREVLHMLVRAFAEEGVTHLCEPSIMGGGWYVPDIVTIDPYSGVHVLEVKGVTLDRVQAVRAGGAVEIDYGHNVSRKDPSRQARNAMFDIKNAASKHFRESLQVPFQSWAIFPRISRPEWRQKFGDAVSLRNDVLFQDDLRTEQLKARLQRAGVARLKYFGLRQCPRKQMRCVLAALEDSEAMREVSQNSAPLNAGCAWQEGGNRRSGRFEPTTEVSDELEGLRQVIEKTLCGASSWNDIQDRLAEYGVEYYPRGGGLAIRGAKGGAHICKASDVGPGYSALISKIRAPFPGHSHHWISDRILGVSS
jgi:hypothetical protein